MKKKLKRLWKKVIKKKDPHILPYSGMVDPYASVSCMTCGRMYCDCYKKSMTQKQWKKSKYYYEIDA